MAELSISDRTIWGGLTLVGAASGPFSVLREPPANSWAKLR